MSKRRINTCLQRTRGNRLTALLTPMALIEKSAGARAGVPCRANGGHDSLPCDSE
ncbi:MAG: hypothetical protein V3R25_03895 [Nitrosomonadaceae bacterium]